MVLLIQKERGKPLQKKGNDYYDERKRNERNRQRLPRGRPQAEQEMAKNFCEGEVATMIETEAKKGAYSVVVSIPSGVGTLLVMDYLENNGYEVERKSGHLLVKW